MARLRNATLVADVQTESSLRLQEAINVTFGVEHAYDLNTVCRRPVEDYVLSKSSDVPHAQALEGAVVVAPPRPDLRHHHKLCERAFSRSEKPFRCFG